MYTQTIKAVQVLGISILWEDDEDREDGTHRSPPNVARRIDPYEFGSSEITSATSCSVVVGSTTRAGMAGKVGKEGKRRTRQGCQQRFSKGDRPSSPHGPTYISHPSKTHPTHPMEGCVLYQTVGSHRITTVAFILGDIQSGN